ncbi:hypothetical protein EVJ58_g7085 [Rhodofomes roseus]|uniref:E2 ubiquitin-conjugating enzyme n=1 Tax=Rhodofomes roseus TaxID=34475 RepID=A0A4Y9Y923_9APHY|nr:hypothetical protein EVJ58_g7085 [Rhodofomes roseus]
MSIGALPGLTSDSQHASPALLIRSLQTTLKRIHREIADLKKEDLGSITLAPSDDNLFSWTATIPGPEGSVYEGGLFHVEISLAHDYPFSAPKVTFRTRIYHMNINERGNICIDILKHNWSPALSLFKVILSLSSLLTDPNPKDPLVPSIATEYVRNRTKHNQTARQWTELYARPPTSTSASVKGKERTRSSAASDGGCWDTFVQHSWQYVIIFDHAAVDPWEEGPNDKETTGTRTLGDCGGPWTITMSKSELILVTGASGFIGSHVVVQLLEAGYRVRGTARGAKLDVLRSAFTNTNFEGTAIDDIATSDFTSALQGVDAVIHVASPLAGRESPEVTLNSAVEGTLNILRQAVKAGVSNVVLTSSWATTIDPGSSSFTGVTFTEKDWGKITKEQLFNPELNALAVYCGTKILAERAAWEFARANSELDLATINPPFVYGRPVPGVASGSGINSLGTNGLLYQLIAGEPGRPLPPADPALPSGSDVEEKRFLVAGPATMLYADAVKTLLEERPALKNRFPTRENAPPLPGPLSTVDTTRAKEVLGMREYRGAKDTLLETIDVLLEVEKTWQ